MKDKTKREMFDKVKWVMGGDGMWENPMADKKCETCRGHGVVDEGYNYGCILDNCPDCYNK